MCDGDLDFDLFRFEGLTEDLVSVGFTSSFSTELAEAALSLFSLSGEDDGDLDFELSLDDADSDETDLDLEIPSSTCFNRY